MSRRRRAIRQAEVGAAQHDDRAHAGALRPLPGAAGRRHRLRLGRDADWLVHERGIEPHIPVFDKSERTDGTFSRERLHLRPRPRRLHLPGRQGAQAAPEGLSSAATTRRRRRHDALSRQQARLRRLRAEAALLSERRRRARSRARSTKALATWPATSPRPRPTPTSRRQRKKVEMLFAHLKRILRLDRLRLTRTERRPRRVPPRRHRPEPPEARQKPTLTDHPQADIRRPDAAITTSSWRPPRCAPVVPVALEPQQNANSTTSPKT